MKKNVCLVTCYINNYGACLQAYALQQTIKNLGYNCEILKYTPSDSVKEFSFIQKMFEFAKDIYRILKYDNYSYFFSLKPCFRRFRKKNLIFTNRNFIDENSVYSSHIKFDAYVVGSDQLWNPLIHGNQNNKIYFLDFVDDGAKKIAYAPSFGISSLPSENIERNAAAMLASFDFLSCREEDGSAIVRSLTNKECFTVLDPTFLLSSKEWDLLRIELPKQKKYILVYKFGNNDYEVNFIEYISHITQFEVVIIPCIKEDFSLKYRKINKGGPETFLSYIKNAALVITDSFHATALSINFNVPFFSMLRNTKDEKNNMNSRILNILSMMKLEDRLVTCESNFQNFVKVDMDFSTSNSILDAKRTIDISRLRDALI